MLRLDFHLHTNFSDGVFPPDEVVRKAAKNNVRIISITDHDSVGAFEHAKPVADETGVSLIPGCEFSTSRDSREVHIAGYFTDGIPQSAFDFTEDIRSDRIKRIKEGIKNLQGAGLDITFEETLEIARGESMSRAHLAQVLIKKGDVKDIVEAFSVYLGNDCGLVPVSFRSPEEILDYLTDCGAVSVWAHPEVDIFEDFLPDFIAHGLKGVETMNKRKSSPETTAYFEDAAEEHNLLVTLGSDWHGYGKATEVTGFEVDIKKYRPFLKQFPKFIDAAILEL
ncbi:MAG: PHP domain-containing protein [Planctomycetota bacterium]|jgi:predicted metal-dependent phosphoesterase TrpH